MRTSAPTRIKATHDLERQGMKRATHDLGVPKIEFYFWNEKSTSHSANELKFFLSFNKDFLRVGGLI